MESSSNEVSQPLETTQRVSSSSGSPTAEDTGGSTLLSQLSLRDRGLDHLQKTFDLPDSERLVDDYLCALRKRILLQGRMYVFEHHLAFYANIFGYVKTKCIAFSEITAIKKRKNYGFPNSIEIMWLGGQREFFTSFLSRDDAYELLLYLWHQDRCAMMCIIDMVQQQTHSAYAKLFAGALPKQRLPKGACVSRICYCHTVIDCHSNRPQVTRRGQHVVQDVHRVRPCRHDDRPV